MLVSIIIPAYNVEEYIEECIHSTLSQTFDDKEIIIVDNGSSDSTLEKVQELKKIYPEIIIAEEKQKGAPFARNKGVKIAKGEWIQFLDADDLLLHNKIEHQISLVEQNPNFPFISASSFFQNAKGERIEKQPLEDVWKGLFITRLGITSANLFRKSSLMSIGLWDTSLKSSQEYNLMFRLIKEFGNPAFDLVPLTVVRERHSGQISQRNPKEKWEQYLQLRIEIINYLKERKPDYYKANQDFFHQELFSVLRTIYPINKQIAYQTFIQYLGSGFKPKESNTSSKLYCTLFNLFGFRLTELIKSKLFSLKNPIKFTNV